MTYGLISDLIDGRMSAQGVGWALKALGTAKRKERASNKSTAKASFDMASVPWQRVVNSQGGTSTHKIADIPPGLQQHLLEAEGIVFDNEGKMDLKEYLWMEGLGSKQTAKKSLKKTPSGLKPVSEPNMKRTIKAALEPRTKVAAKPKTKAASKLKTNAVSKPKTKAASKPRPRSPKKPSGDKRIRSAR